MKLQTSASLILFLAAIAPVALAADATTERLESVPDANPACMDRNGPDCVLKSQIVAPRYAAPPVTAIPPVAVPPVGAPMFPPQITTTDNTNVVVPPGSTIITPRGATGSTGSTGTTGSTSSTGSATIIAPQGSTLISPRR